jgi:hypothetical protein
MPFNHYAKIKRIIDQHPGWYVVRINEPTAAKKFNGETVLYDHYYRVYSVSTNASIPYCKFQQLERFARAVQVPTESIPVIDYSDLTI